MGLMVSEKKLFCFSHYKSMGANDPRSMVSLDPRGLIGRIYERGPLNIATYQIYSWFHRRKGFPIISVRELMKFEERASFICAHACFFFKLCILITQHIQPIKMYLLNYINQSRTQEATLTDSLHELMSVSK